MTKYNIVKIVCILLIVATVAVCAYGSYRYISVYHSEHLVPNHEDIVAAADAGIQLAVIKTNTSGSPYDIVGLLAHYNGYDENTLGIKVSNTNDIDIQLIAIRDMDFSLRYSFEPDTVLAHTDGYKVYKQYTFFDVSPDFVSELDGIYLEYMYDDGIVHSTPVSPFMVDDYTAFDSTQIRQKDNLSSFDFVEIENNVITFTGKNITIDTPMFIPAGMRLDISAGQSIDLTNGSYIRSNSAIRSIGTEGMEVIFHTSDSTGRGIFVSQSETKSMLEYTHFVGLDTPMSGIWGLTGAVTFYESDVDISDCVFQRNVCEDALNTIRSDFHIRSTSFLDIYADAFDADFCTGVVDDCYFDNTGNDGIDISTSDVQVVGVTLSNIGDKAISGGENCNLNIKDVYIENAIVGIASKDMSHIYGRDITINDTMIAMTLYQKKPEFGPATIDVADVELLGNISIDYLIEKDSKMIVDGQRVYPISTTKEGILFDKMISGEPLR